MEYYTYKDMTPRGEMYQRKARIPYHNSIEVGQEEQNSPKIDIENQGNGKEVEGGGFWGDFWTGFKMPFQWMIKNVL